MSWKLNDGGHLVVTKFAGSAQMTAGILLVFEPCGDADERISTTRTDARQGVSNENVRFHDVINGAGRNQQVLLSKDEVWKAGTGTESDAACFMSSEEVTSQYNWLERRATLIRAKLPEMPEAVRKADYSSNEGKVIMRDFVRGVCRWMLTVMQQVRRHPSYAGKSIAVTLPTFWFSQGGPALEELACGWVNMRVWGFFVDALARIANSIHGQQVQIYTSNYANTTLLEYLNGRVNGSGWPGRVSMFKRVFAFSDTPAEVRRLLKCNYDSARRMCIISDKPRDGWKGKLEEYVVGSVSRFSLRDLKSSVQTLQANIGRMPCFKGMRVVEDFDSFLSDEAMQGGMFQLDCGYDCIHPTGTWSTLYDKACPNSMAFRKYFMPVSLALINPEGLESLAPGDFCGQIEESKRFDLLRDFCAGVGGDLFESKPALGVHVPSHKFAGSARFSAHGLTAESWQDNCDLSSVLLVRDTPVGENAKQTVHQVFCSVLPGAKQEAGGLWKYLDIALLRAQYLGALHAAVLYAAGDRKVYLTLLGLKSGTPPIRALEAIEHAMKQLQSGHDIEVTLIVDPDTAKDSGVSSGVQRLMGTFKGSSGKKVARSQSVPDLKRRDSASSKGPGPASQT
jgi:hypothetical protein